jgi:hypothetical protein
LTFFNRYAIVSHPKDGRLGHIVAIRPRSQVTTPCSVALENHLVFDVAFDLPSSVEEIYYLSTQELEIGTGNCTPELWSSEDILRYDYVIRNDM